MKDDETNEIFKESFGKNSNSIFLNQLEESKSQAIKLFRSTLKVDSCFVSDNARTKLKDNILFPLLFPQIFYNASFQLIREILIVGPKSWGKSRLTKSIAWESKTPLIVFTPSNSTLILIANFSIESVYTEVVCPNNYISESSSDCDLNS